MLVCLVLAELYDAGGQMRLGENHRLVSVDLDRSEERRYLRRFRTKAGAVCWGLTCEDGSWWRVEEAFELREPTSELHDGKYPVAFHMDDDLLAEAVAADVRVAGTTTGAAMPPYWLVWEEWCYPTESGREPHPVTFDTEAGALAACMELADAERANFDANGMDGLPPARYGDGFIITTKMGLDPFYYYARFMKIEPLGLGKDDNGHKAH